LKAVLPALPLHNGAVYRQYILFGKFHRLARIPLE